jgi:hypothetical protein
MQLWNDTSWLIHLEHYRLCCDVIMAIFWGSAVLCFTRPPRWSAGRERDLKIAKRKTIAKTKPVIIVTSTNVQYSSNRYSLEAKRLLLQETYLCCSHS